MAHQDAFLRPRLNARCRFSQETFAGTRGNGRDAPEAVVREIGGNRQARPIGTASISNPPVGLRGTPTKSVPHARRAPNLS